MTITQDKEIDLFVASKIGSFKHIKFHTESSKNSKKCIENLVEIKSLQKDDGITCMRWGNTDHTEILIARKNQQIQVYSTDTSSFTRHSADFAPGHIVGLGRCKRKLLAASSSGVVRVWSRKGEELVNTGGKLDTMRVCDDEPQLFVTGGEENDIKLWSVGAQEPVFAGKNLPHDWLQLRRPVWVAGAAFARGEGGRLLAACSRHGYVRLYDTRAQRRPVINVEFPNMAATCIQPSFDERQFLVGFGRGQLHQVDLRVGRPDKGFKGCAGAITDIATAPRERLVVSTSLDRHLRVHRFDSKEMVYKQYLTSKLVCVLTQTEASTPLRNADVKEEDVKEEDGVEEVKVGDDLDEIFERMETIDEKPRKKKSEDTNETEPAKKLKPSTEGSTGNTTAGPTEVTEDPTEVTEDPTEDSIVQLLRSTEKIKRRREKKKREKKAKSVFHNA